MKLVSVSMDSENNDVKGGSSSTPKGRKGKRSHGLDSSDADPATKRQTRSMARFSLQGQSI